MVIAIVIVVVIGIGIGIVIVIGIIIIIIIIIIIFIIIINMLAYPNALSRFLVKISSDWIVPHHMYEQSFRSK